MTRRRARLASCALATSVLVTAATGCSLIVGLGADAVPAPVDAAVVDATTVTPFVCPAGTGWQLDCSFGAAPGVVFARQAMGPGSVFSYAASSGLYVSATLDQGGLETVVTSYQVDGSAGNAQVVFEGGALAVSAANVMSIQAVAAITTADLDANVQVPVVQVFEDTTFPPISFGQVRVDTPNEGPRPIGFALDTATQAVLGFISANFVAPDGSTLPGVAIFAGTLEVPPHAIGVSYAGRDEPGEAGADGAPTYPFASPLVRTSIGVGLPEGTGEDFWLGGVTADDAGAVELFLDAQTASPSLRIPLAFIPECAAIPALGLLLGRTSTGIALQELPLPTSFDGFPAIPAPSEIPVAEVAKLGTVRAAWNGVDQVTAMALSADGDVVFVQWKLDEHDAGTANAEVTVNTDFGQGGVLRVRFPTGTRLGDIAYDLGAYYFTVQLPDGDDSLLRLVDGSADGGS